MDGPNMGHVTCVPESSETLMRIWSALIESTTMAHPVLISLGK
jgi:hypothetical protein